MRTSRLSCASASLLCCGALTAQTVWPQGLAAVNGGSSKATPFSVSSSIAPARTRAVIAIAGSSVPFSSGHPIAGIAFRRDAVHGATYGGYSATMQVRIRAVADAASLTGSAHRIFLLEHEVYSGSIAIPAAPAPSGAVPAPFALRIPFASTWTYPGGDFAIEVTVSGPAGSAWRCDAVDLSWSDGGRSYGVGGGCATSAGDLPPMRVRELTSVRPGGHIEYVVDRLAPPPNGGAIFFVWGTAVPGLSLGPQFAPGCKQYVSPIFASLLGLYGNRLINHARGGTVVSLPNSMAFTGVHLVAQGVFLDFGLATPLPIGVTQAVDVEIGALSPSAFVGRTQWIYGSKTPGLTQGLVLGRPNEVPVIEFF